MNFDLVASNFLSPPVLFFFLGVIAVLLRSDLDIPQPLPKLFSLYLLLSIGFRGGAELRQSEPGWAVAAALGAAVLLSMLLPLAAWPLLRRRLGPMDGAAVAATYGSVSAVTFVAATSFLGKLEVPYGGHMVAALALMESPAIVLGVALSRLSRDKAVGAGFAWGSLFREAFLNGSVFVLVGSLLVGLLTGHDGEVALAPFTTGIFKGMLALFLLDMGLVCGRRLASLRRMGGFPVGFALAAPLVQAAVAIGLARLAGLSAGDAFLLTVLAASASYIAVPAAVRHAIPEANPGLYVTMALAVTFPFNILLGLPVYMAVIDSIWR